jgi:hypothetical protein
MPHGAVMAQHYILAATAFGRRRRGTVEEEEFIQFQYSKCVEDDGEMLQPSPSSWG